MRIIMETLAKDTRFKFEKEEWRLLAQLCEHLDGKDLYDVIDIRKKVNLILDTALIEAAKSEANL